MLQVRVSNDSFGSVEGKRPRVIPYNQVCFAFHTVAIKKKQKTNITPWNLAVL